MCPKKRGKIKLFGDSGNGLIYGMSVGVVIGTIAGIMLEYRKKGSA